MTFFRRILVGIELTPRTQEVTPGSVTAFAQARRAAQESGGDLTLVHSTWHQGEGRPLTADGEAALMALREEAAAVGINARLEVTEVRPWLAMMHAVLRGEADLVVVGKRDRESSEGEGRRLGSVATKLVRKCPAPVWVVKPAHDLAHKLVLVATDHTPVAERALELGAFVAKRRGAALHVVHAYRVPRELRAELNELPSEELAERMDLLKSDVQARLDACLAQLDLPEPAVTHLSRKTPAEAIKETVEHLQPDLLVMGSLSRGGRAGVMVGETAERLLDRLDCSMLTIKPDDFESPVPRD
jgi:universal stress protein E